MTNAVAEATTSGAATPAGNGPGGDDDGSSVESRAVITLSPAAASAARRLANEMGGVGLTEVARRGLLFVDLYTGLNENEELVIRNRETGDLERIRFAWDLGS